MRTIDEFPSGSIDKAPDLTDGTTRVADPTVELSEKCTCLPSACLPVCGSLRCDYSDRNRFGQSLQNYPCWLHATLVLTDGEHLRSFYLHREVIPVDQCGAMLRKDKTLSHTLDWSVTEGTQYLGQPEGGGVFI